MLRERRMAGELVDVTLAATGASPRSSMAAPEGRDELRRIDADVALVVVGHALALLA